MKILLMMIMILTTFSLFADGDAARGKLIYGKKKAPELKATKTKQGNCLQCHGTDGLGKASKKNGEWKINMMKGARIAGLPEAYVYEQLKDIQTKKRKTKNTGTMHTRIKKYTDQDLKDLAAYVSTALNPGAGTYKSEVWPRKD